MMESGAIEPPVGATYPFEDFGRALTDMEDAQASGSRSSASGTARTGHLSGAIRG